MIHASNRVQISVQSDWLESHVSLVLSALNGDWGGNDKSVRSAYRCRTLILLIKRIQQIETAAGDIGIKFARLQRGDVRVAKLIASPEFVKLQSKLDRFLLRFRASPRIQLHPVLKPGVRETTMFWGLSWVAPYSATRFWYEVPLLNEIVQIAKHGRINALRQCKQCQRWMFARRSAIDSFCSPECRDLYHRTNEADRIRRRNWARTNYQSHKELELGSRKAAQRKGGKR